MKKVVWKMLIFLLNFESPMLFGTHDELLSVLNDVNLISGQ